MHGYQMKKTLRLNGGERRADGNREKQRCIIHCLEYICLRCTWTASFIGSSRQASGL